MVPLKKQKKQKKTHVEELQLLNTSETLEWKLRVYTSCPWSNYNSNVSVDIKQPNFVSVLYMDVASCQTHLQLQEESPALLPLLNPFKKLFVILIMLLQALDLSIVQT